MKVLEQNRVIRIADEEMIRRLVKRLPTIETPIPAPMSVALVAAANWLAATIGWDSVRVEQIRQAAPMHDAGKIGIPDAILCKAWQAHARGVFRDAIHITQLGANLLSGSQSPVMRMAHEIALAHHERWDGSGYPYGLKGSEIPEAARELSRSWMYTTRCRTIEVYRLALPEAKVLEILRAGQRHGILTRICSTPSCP